jgi:hypothetical protein
MANNIWFPPLPEQIQWVHLFKEIFILQKKESIDLIFNSELFGYHNACNLQEYCDYEFDEFALKCDKFNLTLEANVECYKLKNNFFYFSLGKKDDKAVFEAIFQWDKNTSKAIGNGYRFKIEPKTQFIKNILGEKNTLRRINITPKFDMDIKAIIQKEPGDDFIFNSMFLEPHLGGKFYNIQYQRESENNLSFWDELKIVTNQGVFNHTALMRGIDHPLFISNLFPIISSDLKTINIEKNIFPVILYVLFENGNELYFKYPLIHEWHFEQKISKVCLTDTLSFDWIIEI